MDTNSNRKEYELHLGAKNYLFGNAKVLRKEHTAAEKKLWQYLRNRMLNGYKFRRQHPLFDFIADFYCHEKKLVVEVDGGYHLDCQQTEKDDGRTYELNQYDIKVIRFSNEEVMNDIELVLSKILEELQKRNL
ncbi:MAG: hypothetical protein C0599_00080 [Salinivirgaceae bacterium]|nr:MAG: hypothetical protein C0599_00080 [Salinivirgaceae bacterium]